MLSSLLALDFPPVSHVIEWPGLALEGSPFEINKIVILMWVSAAIAFFFMFLAGRDFKLVPRGVQNLGETFVEFIENSIILETMGPDGLKFMPFLGTLFVYILICNVWGIIPALQMPVNARIALPAFLAILVWCIYNFVGIRANGFFGYFKSFMFPPGVPKALYILVTPIEFVSTIFVRPLSLAVRLFANMLAGHLILVSFAVLATALFESTIVLAVLPGALLVALTGFEVLVVFLQAYIFTILAAVFIGGAMHPEH